MTSSRRAVFFALFLFPSAVVFGVACGQGSTMPPPPPPPPDYDSGPRHFDTGALDTAPPDTTDTAPPDTFMPDTFEAAVDACEASVTDAGEVIVAPSSLEFGNMGFVNCGTQSTPEVITITNPTCTPFNWMSAVTGMGGYMLSPASGTMLMPGATQMIQVTPAMVPTTAAITPDLFQGTVTITTTAPNDTGHIIQLHETAYGVILTTTSGAAIPFGPVNIGQMPTSQYNVSNNGNAPTTVSFTVGSPNFTVTPSFPLAAMASSVVTVKFLPMMLQPYTDQITTTVPAGTPLCALIPPPVQLTGTGTPVPTGVTVMPATINFAEVNCGTQAPLQTITLNTSNVGMNATYTAQFMNGSTRFTLAAYNAASPSMPGAAIATGVAQPLPPMGPLMIDIVPNAIPSVAPTTAGGFNDTLTITTNVPMDPMHTVAIQETAQGAILNFSPMTFSTSGTPGTISTTTINVTNTGNLAAGFTLSLGAETPMPASPAFSLSAADAGTVMATAPGAGMFPAQLEVDPPPLGGASTEGGAGTTFQTTGSMHLDVAMGAVLCAAPPNDVTLFVTN